MSPCIPGSGGLHLVDLVRTRVEEDQQAADVGEHRRGARMRLAMIGTSGTARD
jgi:hypothetical protein